MKTKSIQGKLTRLYVTGIVVITLLLVMMSIIIMSKYSKDNAEVILHGSSTGQALKIDRQFMLAEQAVKDICLIAAEKIPAIEDLKDEEKAWAYLDEITDSIVSIASNTDNALTVYYHLNPDLCVDGTVGLFYVMNARTKRLEEFETTDLNAYPADDMEHVGWYFEPVRAGKGIWMEPYYNKNIKVEMVSYAVPIYVEGQLVGVIGLDLDFEKILTLASAINTYDGDDCALFCMSNRTVYSRANSPFDEKIEDEMHDIMSTSRANTLLEYKKNTQTYLMSYYTLRNGMKLVMYVPKGNIFYQRDTLILIEICIGIATALIMLFIATKRTKSIVNPIKEITEATREYASGNWEKKLEDCKTNDELEVLTESVKIMAFNTKNYIRDINATAYKDPLCGIRNKSSYLKYLEDMQDSDAPYAVAVFDLNNLKYVNDTLGHEEGDRFIIKGSKVICNYFKCSPVFRIGGDEFVAIVNSDDYSRVGEIIEKMQSYMRILAKENKPDAVVIASGYAVAGVDANDYDELFKIADERMYKNKQEIKAESKGV